MTFDLDRCNYRSAALPDGCPESSSVNVGDLAYCQEHGRVVKANRKWLIENWQNLVKELPEK